MRAALLVLFLGLTASCDARMARVDRNTAAPSADLMVEIPLATGQAQAKTISVVQGFATAGSPPTPAAAMLVRTARVALEVSSLDSAIGAARDIVDRHGGFAAGLNRTWR